MSNPIHDRTRGVTGYAVAIRRKGGSLFFASPPEGFSTRVWFRRASALARAKAFREHKLDAIVVKVEYQEPVIIGPARYLPTPPHGDKEKTP